MSQKIATGNRVTRRNKVTITTLLLGLLLIGCFAKVPPAEEAAVDWTQAKEPEKFVSLIPRLAELAPKLGTPFQLTTHTEFEIHPPKHGEGKGTDEKRTYDVSLTEDAQKNWHLRYQMQNPKNADLQIGETMMAQGQFYRRIPDNPWIHREREAEEQERLLDAQDQTRVMLELVTKFLVISGPTRSQWQGRPVLEFVLSKRDWVESSPTPASGSSRTKWRKNIQVDLLQGRVFVDEKLKVPLWIDLNLSFRTSRPSISLEGNHTFQNNENEHKKEEEVKITVLHQWDLNIQKEHLSVKPPQEFQEAPMRNRNKPFDLLPSLKKGKSSPVGEILSGTRKRTRETYVRYVDRASADARRKRSQLGNS